MDAHHTTPRGAPIAPRLSKTPSILPMLRNDASFSIVPAPLLSGLVCLLLLLISPLGAQEKPYGIEKRVANTTLLVNLKQGAPAATISQTGLFSDTAKQIVAPGIIPYTVNSELWSDGAYKTRFFALPGSAQIVFSRDGIWQFPPHSVLVKNFYLEFVKGDPTSRQIVETRFLIKDEDGTWKGFSYQWNDDATEATLLRDSAYLTFFISDASAADGFVQQRYFYPGPEDCSLCHTAAAGHVLGPTTGQLNGDFTYGNRTDNQLRTLNHISLFSEDIGEDYSLFPRWPNPRDDSAALEERARAYLAANCSHCHRPGVVDRTFLDLRFSTPLHQTQTINVSPTLGRLDADPDDARIINPGNGENSTLLLRTLSFSSFRMPPVASNIIDQRGVQLLRNWIDSLDPATSITEAEQNAQPLDFHLGQNYPNPFNPHTAIDYAIATSGPVELTIFGLLGQPVRTLLHSDHANGHYQIHWDGHTSDGTPAASGVYFYRLTSVDGQYVRRLLLLR
jgi:uncharacterized repeat protein (TIGR03806 family)